MGLERSQLVAGLWMGSVQRSRRVTELRGVICWTRVESEEGV